MIGNRLRAALTYGGRKKWSFLWHLHPASATIFTNNRWNSNQYFKTAEHLFEHLTDLSVDYRHRKYFKPYRYVGIYLFSFIVFLNSVWQAGIDRCSCRQDFSGNTQLRTAWYMWWYYSGNTLTATHAYVFSGTQKVSKEKDKWKGRQKMMVGKQKM